MDIKNKFFWFAGASIGIILLIFSALAVLFWSQLTPGDAAALLRISKQYMIYFFGGAMLLMGIVVFVLDAIFHTYIIPISRLTEETQIINSVNPLHRITPDGSKDIERLARIINDGADRFQALKKEVDEKIFKATHEATAEKNILAAILSELPEGVLICNSGGQILLYNNRAKEFLGTGSTPDHPGERSGGYIGLGRSIFGIIDRNCIVHALDEISDKLQRDEENVVAYFVAAGKGKNLLRAETVPVLNPQRQFTGFILILYDISEQLDTEARIGQLFQSLTTEMRHSSAGIRSAVEALLEYPEMNRGQLDSFLAIIHKESVNMGDVINKDQVLSSVRFRTQWPLIQTFAKSLVASLGKRLEEELNIALHIDPGDENHWVNVCSYSFIFAAVYILERLAQETDRRIFNCAIRKTNGFITVEFRWRGVPVKIGTLRQWGKLHPGLGDEKIPLTLDEVMGYHDGEIWSYPSKNDAGSACLGLFLPAVEIQEPGTIRRVTILPESRPEFYDFDLFSQPGQLPELEKCLLTELPCTVFDTETTGLNPSGGDEIISIGAVRIVNGRLLREDVFEQIIDPKRDLPLESIRFHGIQPEMLQGQPTIDKVLPLFQKFSEKTILIAHNAAFDMRMLQVKEEATGVTFINPVLDTMLLSAVVHPAQGDHNLEAIAERLGVQVVGRHTALGDALVTGEIFLKLVPLLTEKGIKTLKEARMASQNTYYARLKY